MNRSFLSRSLVNVWDVYETLRLRRTYDHQRSYGPYRINFVCTLYIVLILIYDIFPFSLLVSHERVHATVNKFTCHQCGKSFKLANYLRKHLLRHKGEANKRKICTICGKKYVNNVDLRLHLKKVHGIDRKTEQVPETVDPIST